MKTLIIWLTLATTISARKMFFCALSFLAVLTSCEKTDSAKPKPHQGTFGHYPAPPPPKVTEVTDDEVYMVASDEVAIGQSVVLMDTVRKGGTGNFMPFHSSETGTISYVASEKLTYGDQVKITKQFEGDSLVSITVKKIDRPKKK